MKIKMYLSICLSICLLFLFAVPSFALTSSTSDNLFSSSSVVNNLISLVPDNTDYVIWNDSDNSYYLAYGGISVNNNSFTSDDVNLVHYYRSGSIASYNYSFSNNQSLSLNVSKVVTSNVPHYLSSVNLNYENHRLSHLIYIALLVAAIFTVFNTVRGWIGGRYY